MHPFCGRDGALEFKVKKKDKFRRPACQFSNRAGLDDEFKIPFRPGVWYDPVSDPVQTADVSGIRHGLPKMHPSLNQARHANFPVFSRSAAN